MGGGPMRPPLSMVLFGLAGRLESWLAGTRTGVALAASWRALRWPYPDRPAGWERGAFHDPIVYNDSCDQQQR
eukprot:scaffold27377_cov42-Tisochrysis_lutea.AAC.1